MLQYRASCRFQSTVAAAAASKGPEAPSSRYRSAPGGRRRLQRGAIAYRSACAVALDAAGLPGEVTLLRLGGGVAQRFEKITPRARRFPADGGLHRHVATRLLLEID